VVALILLQPQLVAIGWMSADNVLDLSIGLLFLVIAYGVLVVGVFILHVLALTPRALALEARGAKVGPPRTLSSSQRVEVADALRKRDWRPSSDDFILRFSDNCNECEAFARQLEDAFAEAGHPTQADITPNEYKGIFGVRFQVRDIWAIPSHANILAAALDRAGVRFEWWQNPKLNDDRACLFIHRQAGSVG
jgi:hypothetical protein